MSHTLFDEASKLRDEWWYSQLIDDASWDDARWRLYQFGPINGMYAEQNPLLKTYLDKPIDINLLKELFIADVQCSVERVLEGINSETSQRIYEERKKEEEKRISRITRANTPEEVLYEINAYNYLILKNVANESVGYQLRFYQLCREWEIYDRDRSLFRLISPEVSQYIEQNTLGVREGKRYGLITLDDSRELLVMSPPRILDVKNKKTIFLDSFVSWTLAEEISRLYHSKMVGSVSLRGDRMYSGEWRQEILMEAVERGKVFTLDFDKIDVITKMYSPYSYGDQLWVRRENDDLYFEEMDSHLTTENEIYVTRLLHVHVKKANVATIEHTDFELIYYTKKEFEIRKNHPSQRGTAADRKKIFKLDNCSIPFNEMLIMYDVDQKEIRVPFLFWLLNQCMEKKTLLREYFSTTISDVG